MVQNGLNIQFVSKYNKLYQNEPKCIKIQQKVSKGTRMVQNGLNVSKCTRLDQNVQKWCKMG